MLGFSEFLHFIDILGRYYNTFYVEEQYIHIYKVIFKMQRLVCNSKCADCKRHSCSHIQNAYNSLREGAKHRIVPLGKL